MKISKVFASSFLFLTLMGANVNGQDSDTTGLPGDDFSLEGALEMFKKASGPEAFEKLINAENNKVNNLDLNEDGLTDYIKVINRKDKDVQIFVLQAVVSENEFQDIAVIELEKTGAESAVLQIVGDEDIYGEETIVEPGDESGNAYLDFTNSPEGLISGPSLATTSTDAIIVNVWAWPAVRFVYAPGYRLWVSPWAWSARPIWWRPWRPATRIAFAPVRYSYRRHYVIVPTRRVVHAPVIYRPVRVSSVTVRNRNQVAVTKYRSTTVTRGGHKVSRKSTTVTGPRGNSVKRTKTTVRRRRN
ncbi:MAG: hypothetical protein EOO02_08415 [Chitinophagaceae bacterium]|nr:MAG: hypothetical protein EOO02_08415 [Chitinophagaceae bacterium]